MRIDFTSMMDYLTCPSYFKFKRLEKRTSEEESIHLEAGKAMHAGLEQYYRNSDKPTLVRTKMAREALRAAIDASGMLKSRPDTETASGRHGEYQKVVLMSPKHLIKTLDTYMMFYEKERFEVVAAELHLETEITPGLTFHGTVDLVVRSESGALMAVDHKYVSRLGFEFQNFGEPNHQATGYMVLLEANGYGDVNTFIFNGIQKVDKKLDDNPLECFMRVEVQRFAWQKAEWCLTVEKVSRLIKESIDEKFFLQTGPKACNIYGKRCEFASVCLTQESDRAQALASFGVDTWHGFNLEEEK